MRETDERREGAGAGASGRCAVRPKGFSAEVPSTEKNLYEVTDSEQHARMPSPRKPRICAWIRFLELRHPAAVEKRGNYTKLSGKTKPESHTQCFACNAPGL